MSPETWTAIFTGVLTFATIGLWGATYIAVTVSRKSVLAYINVERARICPTGYYFKYPDKDAIWFALDFINVGSMPGLVTEYIATTSVSPDPTNIWRDEVKRTSKVVDRDNPFKILKFEFSSEWDEIFVVGYIKYNDGFNDIGPQFFSIGVNGKTQEYNITGENMGEYLEVKPKRKSA